METKITHNHVYMILNGIRFVGFIVFKAQINDYTHCESNIFNAIKNNGFNLCKIASCSSNVDKKQLTVRLVDKREFNIPEKFKEILSDLPNITLLLDNTKYLFG